jgi:hypothetical protein
MLSRVEVEGGAGGLADASDVRLQNVQAVHDPFAGVLARPEDERPDVAHVDPLGELNELRES